MASEPNKIFTKSDYLTALQASKELNTDEETAYKALKTMYLRRATIAVRTKNSTVIRPIVICAKFSRTGKGGILPYRVRSDALPEIAKYLQEQKNQG